MKSRQSHKFNADSLAARLRESGIELSSAAVEKLWRFHELLRQADPELNLTRIRNFEAIVRKHYVDSLLVIDVLAREGLDLPETLVDVGTGAGFPGVPLAVARPDRKFVLVEGRGQRVEFLNRVVAELSLENVTVVGRRLFAGNPGPAGSIITRAVAGMADTLERTMPARLPGDLYIFMKGPNCDAEIESMLAIGSCRLLCDAAYTLPHSTDHRRLVVWSFEKATGTGTGSEAVSGTGPPVISSPENALLKLARTLSRGRMIRKQGRALVAGTRIIREILERGTPEPEALLLSSVSEAVEQGVVREGSEADVEWRQLPFARFVQPALLREVDPLGAEGPLLMVRVADPPEWTVQGPTRGVSVFLPLGDPENLGAALRSCAAFGVDRVVLAAESAHPFHPRAIRASAGACFQLELHRGPPLAEITMESVPLFALAAGGRDIAEVSFPENLGLVVGEEGGGLPPGLDAVRIGIPIAPAVDSLNGAVALGIALEYIRRRTGSRSVSRGASVTE